MPETLSYGRGLSDNPLIFIEKAADLLKDFNMLLDAISAILGDDKKLRDSAYDYRQLSKIKEHLSENREYPKQITGLLSQNIDYIKRYDKMLAQLILHYIYSRVKQEDVLKELYDVSKEPLKLGANADTLLEKTEIIDDGGLKSKIRSRIVLIKRCFEEIEALHYDIEDVKWWGMHLHYDVNFFTGRVEGYFKGAATSDGKEFVPLEKFGDERLKKAIFESREVKNLYYLGKYTRKSQEQIEYINSLISLLYQDINKETKEWVIGTATRKFYENSKEYAAKFVSDYSNYIFAEFLIKGRERIGENPFEWIKLLEKMIYFLEKASQKKNIMIESAGTYIYSTFNNRIEKLKSSINFIASSLNEILRVGGREHDIIKKIEEGIKRIEKAINKLWKARKKKFEKMKTEVESKNLYILPEINKLIAVADITPEASSTAKIAGRLVQFSKHKDALIGRIDVTNPKHFPFIGMLAFDLARMGDLTGIISKMENLTKQKDFYARTYDYTRIKKYVREMIGTYLLFIEWVKSMGIGVETGNVSEKIRRIRGDYYG